MSIEKDIRKAVKDKITPWNIGRHVKTEPILSTLKAGHRLVPKITDYVPDPDYKAKFIPFWDYKEFIYWKLADLEESVSIVGIAWDDDLNSQMFYGLVLPPD